MALSGGDMGQFPRHRGNVVAGGQLRTAGLSMPSVGQWLGQGVGEHPGVLRPAPSGSPDPQHGAGAAIYGCL